MGKHVAISGSLLGTEKNRTLRSGFGHVALRPEGSKTYVK